MIIVSINKVLAIDASSNDDAVVTTQNSTSTNSIASSSTSWNFKLPSSLPEFKFTLSSSSSYYYYDMVY